MLIWINGAFGVGKSTTAAHVVERSPHVRVFDPEQVGYMLMANLRGLEFADFQELPAWRTLVPILARQVADTTAQQLVAVQTVLTQSYWYELRLGLGAQGFDVVHVVLDAHVDVLAGRIRADERERSAREWRLRHVEAYQRERPWLVASADVVVDTNLHDAAGSAERIASLLL